MVESHLANVVVHCGIMREGGIRLDGGASFVVKFELSQGVEDASGSRGAGFLGRPFPLVVDEHRVAPAHELDQDDPRHCNGILFARVGSFKQV